MRFDAEFAIGSVSFRPTVSNSGRFILSAQRRRKFCRWVCQINSILAIAGMAGKRTVPAIILITPAGLSARLSTLRSM